jgi:hypothetical protein
MKFVFRTVDELRNYGPRISDAMFLVDTFQIMSRPTKNKNDQLLQGHIQLTMCDKMEFKE